MGKVYIGAADLAMDWAFDNVKLVVNCANMEPRCSPALWRVSGHTHHRGPKKFPKVLQELPNVQAQGQAARASNPSHPDHPNQNF
jgi:hypothetical protein